MVVVLILMGITSSPARRVTRCIAGAVLFIPAVIYAVLNYGRPVVEAPHFAAHGDASSSSNFIAIFATGLILITDFFLTKLFLRIFYCTVRLR